VKDPTAQLRSATRRAKSDVANKLISMCLHELSRRISENWPIKVDGEEYEELVRNSEKRRDDSLRVLSLGMSGWESFLSHEGTRCAASCLTCRYWKSIWEDETERRLGLSENLQRIRSFRSAFSEFEQVLPSLAETLPALLTKLYSDCQTFAETEIKSLLQSFGGIPDTRT
jgi:hypothetical protein